MVIPEVLAIDTTKTPLPISTSASGIKTSEQNEDSAASEHPKVGISLTDEKDMVQMKDHTSTTDAHSSRQAEKNTRVCILLKCFKRQCD